jgi:hypothetical protein
MQAVFRVFKPLQRALRAFFSDDISLRRKGRGLAIVMQEKSKSGDAERKPAAGDAERREQDELLLILRQLSAVLSEQAQTRSRFRHLVFVEHALQKKGLRALHKLPLDVLQRALEQLEALVTNWAPEGLANLRSKMAVTIIDREHMDPAAEADAYNTAMPLETPEPVLPASAAAAADCGNDPGFDDAALAAAYAALGAAAPAAQVDVQGELASPSAKAATRAAGRIPGALPEIKLRELES